MESKEIEKELGMSYQELVEYLLEKYGTAPCDYFVNESCRTKSKRISRSEEGLECHHIDEDKAIMLSDQRWALKNPFDYQKADRLVYANVLEHLILHMKIVEGPRNIESNALELPGLGGVINFICPQINDYYNGYEYKRPRDIKKFSLIADNFDDYIKVLNYFLKVVKERPGYLAFVTPERLSRGYDGKIVKEIYDKLEHF